MAKYRKLGRTSSQRKALLRGQVTSLIYNGKIITTEARAKEVRKSFYFSLLAYQLNCLRTRKGLSLGELIRLCRIYFS